MKKSLAKVTDSIVVFVAIIVAGAAVIASLYALGFLIALI